MNQEKYSLFSRELREWSRRPPELTAEHASTRVLASLEDSRSLILRRLLQAGGALLLLCIGVFGLHRIDMPQPEMFVPSGTSEVVLIWLDEETPLYMNLGRTAEAKGDHS